MFLTKPQILRVDYNRRESSICPDGVLPHAVRYRWNSFKIISGFNLKNLRKRDVIDVCNFSSHDLLPKRAGDGFQYLCKRKTSNFHTVRLGRVAQSFLEAASRQHVTISECVLCLPEIEKFNSHNTHLCSNCYPHHLPARTQRFIDKRINVEQGVIRIINFFLIFKIIIKETRKFTNRGIFGCDYKIHIFYHTIIVHQLFSINIFYYIIILIYNILYNIIFKQSNITVNCICRPIYRLKIKINISLFKYNI